MNAPTRLLEAARILLERSDPATAGLWPRASALLVRQALEEAIDRYWSLRSRRMAWVNMRAKLLCLRAELPEAAEAAQTWAALSNACHHHPYQLSPTSPELMAWLESAERLIALLERGKPSG